MKKIMKQRHPLWKEFIKRLMGPNACDFRIEKDGNVSWLCDEDFDRPRTRAILETMPEIDVERSLDYLAEAGGCCDCEVIINTIGISGAYRLLSKKPTKKEAVQKKPAEKKVAEKKPAPKKPAEKKPAPKKKPETSKLKASSSKKAKTEKKRPAAKKK